MEGAFFLPAFTVRARATAPVLLVFLDHEVRKSMKGATRACVNPPVHRSPFFPCGTGRNYEVGFAESPPLVALIVSGGTGFEIGQ